MQTTSAPRSLIIMLAGLISIGPLAIDAYLPAMPLMAEKLNTSLHQVELSLSVFLVGFALGQLFGGPFSDRYGRRTTIFLGLALCFAGSLWAAFVPNIEQLWLARFVQAFGGGMGVVNTMAVIRDLYSGVDSAKALSRVVSVMMAAPLLAPFLGSSLLLISGWRSIFWALAAYAGVLLYLLYLKLPETHKPNAKSNISVVQRYKQVLKHRGVIGYLFATAGAQAVLFAFITGSPLLYMQHYGVSTQMFPIYFGLNIVAMLVFNRINVLLLNKLRPEKILVLGQFIQLAAAGVLALSFMFATPPLLFTLALIMLTLGVQGLVMANGTASAVEFFPQSAATTSAAMSASGFSFGALAGALVGIFGSGTPTALLIAMLVSAALGLLLRFIFHAGWRFAVIAD